MTQLDPVAPAPRGVETNGINVVAEQEHRGTPRQLFWPWFASNVSILGMSYGAFVLGFGISFWQATLVAVVGVVFSFLLCGLVSVAGKRGNAPTMTLSRAAFGVEGNRLPALISWLLTVGWETVLVSLAVLATATVFSELEWSGGTAAQVIALVVVAALTVGGGVLGFDVVMRMQRWITVLTGIFTVVYVVLVAHRIDWATVSALPSGTLPALVGALVFTMTGFGLGWVNAAADYSRYLPRASSGRGIVGWTTLGGSAAPIVLVVFGALLAGSSADLSDAIGRDPIGALTTILPHWFLLPFLVIAVLGLVGGAVLDIYSSGLALLSVGVRVPRFVAAGIDGVIMIAGAIYMAFFAGSFLGPFMAFLITLGVPIAAWCGVFLGDLALRRRPYAEDELLDPRGRYGSINALAVVLVLLGTAIGWGFVTSYTPGFEWQGYLLRAVGLGDSSWAGANLGVLFALLLGVVGTVLLGRNRVRAQERVGERVAR